MLIIKAESTSVVIKEIITECIALAKKMDVFVETKINNKTVTVGPMDDLFDVLEKFKAGFYDD